MTLVDTNVLPDILTGDPKWADWSIGQLDAAALRGPLAINGRAVRLSRRRYFAR